METIQVSGKPDMAPPPLRFEAKPSLLDRLRSLLVSNIVYGIDLNRFRRNDLLDAHKIKAAGYDFAIIEATWGLSQPESFSYFWPRCLDAGLFLFAYGFFCGNISGADQADLLLNRVYPMWQACGYKTPLAGDVEPFTTDTSTLSERQENWQDWLDGIRSTVTPMEYSNQPSHQTLLGNMSLPADCLGWAAHYANTNLPRLPVGWSRNQTKFHQYGIATVYPWCPPVPGMKSVVDVDKFYGTLEDLHALALLDLPEPPPPDPIPIPIDGDEDMATILEKIAEIKAVYPDAPVMINVNLSEGTGTPPPDDGGGEPAPVRYRVDTTGKANTQVKVRPTPDASVGQLYFVYHNDIVGGPGRIQNEFFYVEQVNGQAANPPGWVELQWLVKL
jgi:hypothetical protein